MVSRQRPASSKAFVVYNGFLVVFGQKTMVINKNMVTNNGFINPIWFVNFSKNPRLLGSGLRRETILKNDHKKKYFFLAWENL